MKIVSQLTFVLAYLFSISIQAQAAVRTYRLTLEQAETKALSSSQPLKAIEAELVSANRQASAQMAGLFPKLSIQGSYQYFANIPNVSIGNLPPLPFGTNSIYSIGPQLNYTLWDTLSSIKSYKGASLIADSKQEELKNGKIQTLLSVRTSYVRTLFLLEELRLTDQSLQLAKARDSDISRKFKFGGASKLDMLTAHRGVSTYNIQLKQKQTELSRQFRDLLSIIDDPSVEAFAEVGPEGTEGTVVALQFENLPEMVTSWEKNQPEAPNALQPKIKSLSLLAEASEILASSQRSKLFPVIQVVGGFYWLRPNMPNPPDMTQQTVLVNLSLPLYIGDPTPHLASAAQAQAEAASYRKNQIKIEVERDFLKTQETLKSLAVQKELSIQNVKESEEVARLFDLSQKAGRVNLLDVQNAEVQALQAKVNRARVDAEILIQLMTLHSISGKELSRD